MEEVIRPELIIYLYKICMKANGKNRFQNSFSKHRNIPYNDTFWSGMMICTKKYSWKSGSLKALHFWFGFPLRFFWEIHSFVRICVDIHGKEDVEKRDTNVVGWGKKSEEWNCDEKKKNSLTRLQSHIQRIAFVTWWNEKWQEKQTKSS